MPVQSFQRDQQSRILASGRDFALLSTFVTGLAHTVLIQLCRSAPAGRPVFSLYCLYREGGMTFDAIVEFELGARSLPLAEVLEQFATSAEFETVVLTPLAERVGRHFMR